jgi:hypothetical protein
MTMAKSATSRSTRKPSAPKKAAAPKLSPAEKAAHEAEQHAPVGLDSGASYDAGELLHGGGLSKAIDRQSGNREVEVQKALESAKLDKGTNMSAPNALPDHQPMVSETVLSEGVEVGTGKDKQVLGRQTVEEVRQVYVGDGEAKTAADVIGTTQANGGRSDTISLEPIGEKPQAPKPPKPADSGSAEVPATDGETGEPGSTSNLDAVVAGIEGAQGGDAGAGDQA